MAESSWVVGIKGTNLRIVDEFDELVGFQKGYVCSVAKGDIEEEDSAELRLDEVFCV